MPSKPPAPKFKAGPWLPDMPDLDNPGLTEALNVLPVASSYTPYLPISVSGNAMTNTAAVAFIGSDDSVPTDAQLYVGSTAGNIYIQGFPIGGGWTDLAPAGFVGTRVTALCQYNTLIIAANGEAGNPPVYGTLGSLSAFAVLGTGGVDAPPCGVLGVVGQFLFTGNINTTGGPSGALPHAVQWSGIGNPTSWPTPGSATAIAQQSGQQVLHAELGGVTGIYGADEWGVILQAAGVSRLTYIGSPGVFQFDTISRGIGMDFPNAGVKVGGVVYFMSSRGFFATDGVNVLPIGNEKVNKWFLASWDGTTFTNSSAAVDYVNNLIYWNYPRTGDSGVPLGLVVYNFVEQRFTHATDTIRAFAVAAGLTYTALGVQAIDVTTNKAGELSGTAGTATLRTGELELNPGGKSLLQGFRPLVSGSSPSVTCKIGSRMRQGDAITYTSALTPNANTGFADCLIEASFHRAEIDISGAFTQVIGGEFIGNPSGAF
jgi:hypothetical protein